MLCHDAPVVADVVDPDFAVVAVREDGGWRLEKLTPRAWSSLDGLEEILQSWAVDGVAIGLLGVLDEYLLIARREAAADGATDRPTHDKELVKARRAAEKAAGILRRLADG